MRAVEENKEEENARKRTLREIMRRISQCIAERNEHRPDKVFVTLVGFVAGIGEENLTSCKQYQKRNEPRYPVEDAECICEAGSQVRGRNTPR